MLVALVALVVSPCLARADEREADDESAYLPPDPSERSPVRGVEVRFVLPIPVYVRPLCPSGSACILGVGGGVGVVVERRFQSGFSLGGSYELGLHSAEAVYELATLQALGARMRWVFRPESAAHPAFEIGMGIVGIGDVFRVESAAPYLDLSGGGEFEMTPALAFTFGLRARGMAFIPFETGQDGVERSVSPYLDVVATLHAGILWLKPRARAR